MDPVTVSIVVSAPREQVFDYLQDIANHPEFTDHFLVDWHLTRIDSVGRGAGARFRVKAPGNRFSWADVTFAEVERPHRIVEVGRTGKNNRIRTLGVYELAPAAAEHHARALHAADHPGDARRPPAWRRSARAAGMRRKNRRALRRLRDDPRERGQRRGGAGGAPSCNGRRRIDCRVACPVRPRKLRARRARLLLAALALSACGDSHTKVTTGTYAGESGAERARISTSGR